MTHRRGPVKSRPRPRRDAYSCSFSYSFSYSRPVVAVGNGRIGHGLTSDEAVNLEPETKNRLLDTD